LRGELSCALGLGRVPRRWPRRTFVSWSRQVVKSHWTRGSLAVGSWQVSFGHCSLALMNRNDALIADWRSVVCRRP